jgi:nicotinamidase-related amidase
MPRLGRRGQWRERRSTVVAQNPTEGARLARLHEAHRCEPSRTALIVVDMQRGFLDAGASLEVPKGRAMVPNILALLGAFRRRGAAVVFTRFVYSPAVPCLRGDPFGVEHLPPRPGEPTGFGRPSGNCLIGPDASQGPESADIVEALAPLPGELTVDGHTYDKFLGTPLDLALRSRGITQLVVTGLTTDICVNCTVLAASSRDYRVTVATDGVATIEDDLQEACFRIWRRKFARLLACPEIISELDRRA